MLEYHHSISYHFSTTYPFLHFFGGGEYYKYEIQNIFIFLQRTMKRLNIFSFSMLLRGSSLADHSGCPWHYTIISKPISGQTKHTTQPIGTR